MNLTLTLFDKIRNGSHKLYCLICSLAFLTQLLHQILLMIDLQSVLYDSNNCLVLISELLQYLLFFIPQGVLDVIAHTVQICK